MYGANVLTFGKYRGRRLDEVPVSYLRWLADEAEEVPSHLVEAAHHLLEALDDRRCRGASAEQAAATVRALVDAWFYAEAAAPGDEFTERLRQAKRRLLDRLAATFGPEREAWGGPGFPRPRSVIAANEADHVPGRRMVS